MTQTMKLQTAGWKRRGGVAVLGTALAVAMVFGPGVVGTTRLGTGETVGLATVSAADTITSTPVLSGVAAAGRDRSVGDD
ncbi:MAG: hypothetical protein ABW046_20990 [Actinoplanes sp.]